MKIVTFTALCAAIVCAAADQDLVLPRPPEAFINASYAQLAQNINVSIVDPPQGEPDSIAVVLHGLFQPAESVLELVTVIQAAGLNTTRFVIPRAPNNWVDRFQFYGASWYNAPVNISDTLPADQILNAADVISTVADSQANETGIPRSKMVVAGISQGGNIALTTYLRHEWGAALGLSTALVLEERYPAEMTNDSMSAPALLVHGTEDVIIPIPLARLSNNLLQSYGRISNLLEIPGEGHDLDSLAARIQTTAASLSFIKQSLNLS